MVGDKCVFTISSSFEYTSFTFTYSFSYSCLHSFLHSSIHILIFTYSSFQSFLPLSISSPPIPFFCLFRSSLLFILSFIHCIHSSTLILPFLFSFIHFIPLQSGFYIIHSSKSFIHSLLSNHSSIHCFLHPFHPFIHSFTYSSSFSFSFPSSFTSTYLLTLTYHSPTYSFLHPFHPLFHSLSLTHPPDYSFIYPFTFTYSFSYSFFPSSTSQIHPLYHYHPITSSFIHSHPHPFTKYSHQHKIITTIPLFSHSFIHFTNSSTLIIIQTPVHSFIHSLPHPFTNCSPQHKIITANTAKREVKSLKI